MKDLDTKHNAIQSLLIDVKRLIIEQEEKDRKSGEKFNVFSILGMESQENKTHSAFLGELLNPKGSHLMGDLFLRKFLDRIGHEGFDCDSAELALEFHIGVTDVTNKTGGRIDIYLLDGKGNTISIENKIYAGDQEAQIERYVNHNKSKNTVYYLTLNGDLPSNWSKGDLKKDIDFYLISYRLTIIDWLQDCISASSEQPLLKSSLRQYQILLFKLTNQLSDDIMEKETVEIIMNNYESAKVIASVISDVELKIANKFMERIERIVQDKLKNEWAIKLDSDLTKPWKGLSITRKDWNDVYVYLEGQSTIPWDTSYLGIHAHKNSFDRYKLKSSLDKLSIFEGFKENIWWPYYKELYDFTDSNRAKIFDSKHFEKRAIEIAHEIVLISEECREVLKEDFRISSEN